MSLFPGSLSIPNTTRLGVCDSFLACCETFPSRVAVISDSETLHYSSLAERTFSISNHLFGLGIRPSDRVALAVGHDVDIVSSALALLMIGATFVPIDIRNPVERLQYIIKDSSCKAVLYSAGNTERIRDLSTVQVCVDNIDFGRHTTAAPIQIPNGPDDIAYIIYTSGSTGRPKGVCITHANLANYTCWAAKRYLRSSDDCIALYSTLAFDFSITCLLPPLMRGASIRVYDGVSDPFIIRKIVVDPFVTVVKITPSYLSVLAELLPQPSNIRTLIVGGEDLKTSLARRITIGFNHDIEIINEYGPTEATVGCMHHRYEASDDVNASVPLGLPIDNTTIYILDENRKLIQDGAAGEIFIGGHSVALGYRNRPDLTERFFTDNPFSSGRMYQTGDLASTTPDGRLIYLGRKDDQLKIRGYRVHSAEVESALIRTGMVRDAFVTHVEKSRSNLLVAAIALQKSATLDDVRLALRDALPDYMIPSVLIALDQLPMTPNQKVDRNAVLSFAEEKHRNG